MSVHADQEEGPAHVHIRVQKQAKHEIKGAVLAFPKKKKKKKKGIVFGANNGGCQQGDSFFF